MIDLNIHENGHTQETDPENVKRTKKLGSDFLNSLLDLDVLNAGEAATAMHQTLGRVVKKLATVAALMALSKDPQTALAKPLNEAIKEIEAKKTDKAAA